MSFSPLWLHRPVFLPHWNYIPKASGQEQREDGGHVELIGWPVLLCPAPDRDVVLIRAVGVREAASVLSHRYVSPVTKRRSSTLCIPQRGNACLLILIINTRFIHEHTQN